MKLTIDTDTKKLFADGRELPLYSREAFEIISDAWLKVGWNEKYVYTFSWMGRPIIQLPEDMIRFQEVVYRVKPDVIVETGIAHGGSLVYSASLCKLLGKGRVIGVDIDIRSHNRAAIEAHELAPMITMIEGSSTAPEIVAKVKSLVKPDENALVVLDSNHSRAHVRAELEAYASLVKPGSYIVATDGVMSLVSDVPRGEPRWREDNPTEAAKDFAREHPEFVVEEPPWPFNESALQSNVTHWPGAWLRRR